MALTPGEALFARYAFPPNDLGHCGPPGAELLLAGAAGDDDRDLRTRLEQFVGAWPYLDLLAGTMGVGDGLHPDVVSAYWLGGALLDRVEPAAVLAAVGRRFGAQPGVRDRLAALADAPAARPDHLFHVFVVYPWVGLLGAAGDVPRSVLDSCRVRWGTVVRVEGESAGVWSRSLTWDGGALGLDAGQVEDCRWSRGRHAFVRELRPGDQVSLHWNWVCDRLDDDRVAELSARTHAQLTTTNAWLARRDRAEEQPGRSPTGTTGSARRRAG
jgi:hypothetical protein